MWLSLVYVTQLLVAFLSHVAPPPHLAHRSVAARLKPGPCYGPVSACSGAAGTAKQPHLSQGNGSERISSARTELSGYTSTHACGGRGEERRARCSAVLDAAAAVWQNRNKRLTGETRSCAAESGGDGEDGDGGRDKKHRQRFFFCFFFSPSFCLCLAVWRHTGIAVQRSTFEDTQWYCWIIEQWWVDVTQAGALACCRPTGEWRREITCSSRELQVSGEGVDAEDNNKL